MDRLKLVNHPQAAQRNGPIPISPAWDSTQGTPPPAEDLSGARVVSYTDPGRGQAVPDTKSRKRDFLIVGAGGADVEGPAAATELTLADAGYSVFRMEWVVPADRPNGGRPATYSTRRLAGATPITSANWDSCDVSVDWSENTIDPGGNGSVQASNNDLSGDYYFAVRYRDVNLNLGDVATVSATLTTE